MQLRDYEQFRIQCRTLFWSSVLCVGKDRMIFETLDEAVNHLELDRRDNPESYTLEEISSYLQQEKITTTEEFKKSFSVERFLKDQETKDVLKLSKTEKDLLKEYQDFHGLPLTNPTFQQKQEEIRKKEEVVKTYIYNLLLVQEKARESLQDHKEKVEIDTFSQDAAKMWKGVKKNWGKMSGVEKLMIAGGVLLFAVSKNPFLEKVKGKVVGIAGLLTVGTFLNLAPKLFTGKTGITHINQWAEKKDPTKRFEEYLNTPGKERFNALLTAIAAGSTTSFHDYVAAFSQVHEQFEKDGIKHTLPRESSHYAQLLRIEGLEPWQVYAAMDIVLKKFYDSNLNKLKADANSPKMDKVPFSMAVSAKMIETPEGREILKQLDSSILDLPKIALAQGSEWTKNAGKWTAEQCTAFGSWIKTQTGWNIDTTSIKNEIVLTWNQNKIYLETIGNGLWNLVKGVIYVPGAALYWTADAVNWVSSLASDNEEGKRNQLKYLQELTEFLSKGTIEANPTNLLDSNKPDFQYHLGQFADEFKQAYKNNGLKLDGAYLETDDAVYMIVANDLPASSTNDFYKNAQDSALNILRAHINTLPPNTVDGKFLEPIQVVIHNKKIYSFLRKPLPNSTQFQTRSSAPHTALPWKEKYNNIGAFDHFEKRLKKFSQYVYNNVMEPLKVDKTQFQKEFQIQAREFHNLTKFKLLPELRPNMWDNIENEFFFTEMVQTIKTTYPRATINVRDFDDWSEWTLSDIYNWIIWWDY